jgi:copper chaperone
MRDGAIGCKKQCDEGEQTVCKACGCPAAGNEQITFTVEGIHDPQGVEIVEKALLRLPGVFHTHVHAHDGKAIVDYNPGRTSVEDMAKALSVAGFVMQR